MLCSAFLEDDGIGLKNTHFFWDSYHLLNDIWPKQFGGAWTGQLSSDVRGLLYAQSQEEFDSLLDDLMKTFQGKETMLENLRSISQQRNHFAKYVLDDTLGTCGKVSNNPAEQNHASVVAVAGGTLYEDPAFEIKSLLSQQRMLEKKRNQEKAEYQLRIGIELANQDPHDNISQAMKKLDKKPFNLWREEYDLSLHYTVEQNDE